MNPSSADKLGRQFSLRELNDGDLAPDPIAQFAAWFDDALREIPLFPNAMTLATAEGGGAPSARMMLLKGFDEGGFYFYTNSESRKGGEIHRSPKAAMVFWWAELERQVRVEGKIEILSADEADAYFRTRPRGSQVGAWASEQSRVISDRSVLDGKMSELARKYADGEIPRPPYWLGYRLEPESIEFWQGRANRLHDRLRYRRAARRQGWIIERLAP
ncbi:MAG: pyridoxamine 5'-phosphate oxidase [Deltaproteobacteria bacterium]